MMQVALNTRITVETKVSLDEYCKATGKSIASVVEEALKEYIKEERDG